LATDIAVYFQNKAYFTKRGLNKRTVLHELNHHILYVNGVEVHMRTEEKAARSFSKGFFT
jgi:hypothetical protein